MSSSVVDMMRKDVPEYLHGRPHWFVRHCITHIQNATDLDPDSVIQMTSDAFQVPRHYTVTHRATLSQIIASTFNVICAPRSQVPGEAPNTWWS